MGLAEADEERKMLRRAGRWGVQREKGFLIIPGGCRGFQVSEEFQNFLSKDE